MDSTILAALIGAVVSLLIAFVIGYQAKITFIREAHNSRYDAMLIRYTDSVHPAILRLQSVLASSRTYEELRHSHSPWILTKVVNSILLHTPILQ